MELKINEYQVPQAIEFNYAELEREITEKVSTYKNLVYTEEQVAYAKKDRANLNKFIDVLKDARIKVKKEYLKPFEDFESRMKSLQEIVTEPMLLIDKQVKDFEEKRKEVKLNEIKEYFNSLDIPDGLTLEKLFNVKWLNATYKLSDIAKEIIEHVDNFKKAIDVIDRLAKFSFEARQVFIETLDFTRALAEATRLEQQEQKKAEVAPQNEEIGEWVKFEAFLTTAQAISLKQFFIKNNISFRR